MKRSLLWAPVRETGLEHLHLSQRKNEIVADGMVLFEAQGVPTRAHYTIRCQSNWLTRQVAIHTVGLTGARQRLSSDGAGHWFRAGTPLAALDGCLDVDINVTPFTNTLPIRRLALKPGQSAEISVVYIALPQLEIKPVKQRYTCLDLTPEGGRYRYESLASGFTAELRVDADGLVIDYAGIWKRV